MKFNSVYVKDGIIYLSEFMYQKAEELALEYLSWTPQKVWTEVKRLCDEKSAVWVGISNAQVKNHVRNVKS